MYTTTNFAKAVDKIFEGISKAISDDSDITVKAIISGDAAVYYHMGGKVPHSLDVEFSHNIILPGDLAVIYMDGDGIEHELVLSRYKITLGLIHDDYARDALPIISHHPHLDVYVLSALDLAVSMLGRFSDADQSDIKLLADKELYNACELKDRANEALSCYIGDVRRVKQNSQDAVSSIREVH